MKRILFLVSICLLLSACGKRKQSSDNSKPQWQQAESFSHVMQQAYQCAMITAQSGALIGPAIDRSLEVGKDRFQMLDAAKHPNYFSHDHYADLAASTFAAQFYRQANPNAWSSPESEFIAVHPSKWAQCAA